MTGFPEYGDCDALELGSLIARGEVTAGEVLDAALARIEAGNPDLNAVVHMMEGEGRRAIAAGLPKGPLSGVPFLLKDLGLFYKGQRLSNGSRFFDGFVPDFDSTLVERFRAAGLVMIGKTNTPEMGVAMVTEPVALGPCRNPWDTSRSAAGSSGGAAAAVAARLVPIAHATDGGGSIRMPAANCGLFGLKPTRGRTPAGPVVGEGWSGLAGAHCVSLSVRDSAALLDATHGPAPGDPYCAPATARPFLAEVGAPVGRLRIAFSTTAPMGHPVDPQCVRAVEDAARLCADLGHEVEEASFGYDFERAGEALWTIIAGNLRVTLDVRARAIGRSWAEGEIEPVTAALAEDGRRLSAADYAGAVQLVHFLGRQMARFFATRDVWLTPVMAQPPMKLGAITMQEADSLAFRAKMAPAMPFTPIYNITGCPAASVPLYWTQEGLPVGVQIGAAFGGEATLFRLAAQLEAAKPWFGRRPPGF